MVMWTKGCSIILKLSRDALLWSLQVDSSVRVQCVHKISYAYVVPIAAFFLCWQNY